MTTMDNEHYCRITLLTHKGGKLASEQILMRELSRLPGSPDVAAFLGLKKESIKQMKFLHTITKRQYQTLYPTDGTDTNVKDWDLHLMLIIVLEFFTNTLNAQEVTDLKDILRIRNMVCHMSGPALDESEFSATMDTLVGCIYRITKGLDMAIAVKAMDIVCNCKTSPISPKESEELMVLLRRSVESMEDDLVAWIGQGLNVLKPHPASIDTIFRNMTSNGTRVFSDTPLGSALQSRDWKRVDTLLKQSCVLPTHVDLQLALEICDRRSEILKKMCRIVSEHIGRKHCLIKRIWPAYPYDRDEVVFVVLTEADPHNIKDIPYKICFRKSDVYSPEGAVIAYCKESLDKPLTKDDHTLLTTTLQHHSKALMDKHSNIQIISACSVRSKGFGKAWARIKPETCVVIYVDVKGFIPLAEKPLPCKLGDFPVDVREGGVRLHHNKAPHEIYKHQLNDCMIYTDKGTGTLGTFLHFTEKDKLYALTSAHGILSVNAIGEEKFEDGKCEVYKRSCDAPDVRYKIGCVKYALYMPGDLDNSGVEAALIAIGTDSTSCNLSRAKDEHSGVEVKAFEEYKSGEPYTQKALIEQAQKDPTVYKFGCASGLTWGSIFMIGPSIQYRNDILENVGIKLFRQIEVRNIKEQAGSLPSHAFAQPGDSGSLVYTNEMQGEDNIIRAVGILEGGTSYNTYLVTPICDVIKALVPEGGKIDIYQCPLQIVVSSTSK